MDLPAVVAGLTLPYSNGPIEGANTKVKLLKRQSTAEPNFPCYANGSCSHRSTATTVSVPEPLFLRTRARGCLGGAGDAAATVDGGGQPGEVRVGVGDEECGAGDVELVPEGVDLRTAARWRVGGLHVCGGRSRVGRGDRGTSGPPQIPGWLSGAIRVPAVCRLPVRVAADRRQPQHCHCHGC